MRIAIDSIIHSVSRKDDDPLNVLYFGYNGWFECMFGSIGIKCFTKENNTTQYEWAGMLPKTFTVLPSSYPHIPDRIPIDAIICNSRRARLLDIANISRIQHIPFILVEHEIPFKNIKPALRSYINSRLPPKCIHVVPSDFVQKEWCLDDNVNKIPYGIPVAPKTLKNNDVLIAGDFAEEDFGLLQFMLSVHPTAIGIGNNQGLTQPYTNYNDMLEAMCKSRICITAGGQTQSQTLILMAMSAGCVVITNSTPWTEHLKQQHNDIILFEKSSDIKKHVRSLMQNSDHVDQIGFNLCSAIRDNYSYSKFADNWKELLNRVTKEAYIR